MSQQTYFRVRRMSFWFANLTFLIHHHCVGAMETPPEGLTH